MAVVSNETERPYLSVVIPMYNRAALIGRAIDSCLRSSVADCEIIVVDDASTDDSAAIVSRIDHPAVRLVRHDVNRGLGATRNTGVRHARGEWVVMLDSDDELTEGALDAIRRCSFEVPSDVGVLWFRCRMDDGSLTPRPYPREGIWTYETWLSFCEAVVAAGPEGESEMLLVTRRGVHETFHFRENRVPEDLFYLDVAKRYRSCLFPPVLRLYHQDADNRMTKVNSVGGQDHRNRRSAEAETDESARLLARHGRALAAAAPQTYSYYLTRMAGTAFRCGRKRQGLTACLKALARQPLQPRVIGLLIAGLLGSTVF